MRAWLAGLALSLAMCAKPPATTPSLVETPAPAPVASRTEPVPASRHAGSAPPSLSDPAKFACGKLTCASGKQTCCEASSDAVCIPTLPDGPHGTIGFFKDQWEACDKAPFEHGYSLSGISRCDESVDCKSREICCEQFLFSGATVNLCERERASGETPCEFGERCVLGSACRVPGTECRRGYCVKPGKEARCGDGVCACTRPSDCVRGHHCLYESSRGASCTGHVDFVTPNWLEERGLSIVCERDQDCAGACAQGKKMRCSQELVAGLKGCACP